MITVPASEFGAIHPLAIEAAGIGAWVAGGAIRHIVDGGELHDIDLFFPAKERAVECERYFVKRGAEVVFRCEKGELATLKLDSVKIQLCQLDFYASAEAAIDTFDFQCTRFALDGSGVIYPDEAKRDAEGRLLTLHRLTYPAATLHRIQKYIRYGYRLPAETAQRFVDLIAENTELLAASRVYVD